MPDRRSISERFFSHFPGMSRAEVGHIFGDSRVSVTAWAMKGMVPWSRLKYLSDSQGISWDWLLDGLPPKYSTKKSKIPKSTKPKFHRAGISRRFFSLYQEMRQTKIAEELGITSATVSDWKRNISQVPWRRLADAVRTFNVRWDWLLDGVKPKYRE